LTSFGFYVNSRPKPKKKSKTHASLFLAAAGGTIIKNMTKDIRDLIFNHVIGNQYIARISAQGEGILSGIEHLKTACEKIPLQLLSCSQSGERVKPSDTVATLKGNPKELAIGEEALMGWISKASGIATAAWQARKAAGKNLKIVCGAWKKMPPPLKDLIRQAISDGGIPYRITDSPFIYLDKNYVKILGGVEKTLKSVQNLNECKIVIQLQGEQAELRKEALLAAQRGADIIMIDTGRIKDIAIIDSELKARELRNGIRIAFGGNVGIDDLKELKQMPLEIVDIGRAIVDAPLLDMRMEIIEKK